MFLREKMFKRHHVKEVCMNLLKDLWAHLKEWSDWKMKDWIKAAIVALIVIIIIGAI